tara:strand:+ start:22 stop:489 length:468 start_codon:yes stop_codon:yes gene_type:complete
MSAVQQYTDADSHGCNEEPLFNQASAVEQWLMANSLSPDYLDCATAVMLKILDGKCKMPEHEKVIMAALYHAVKDRPGKALADDMHDLIRYACDSLNMNDPSASDENLKMFIYEKRVLAESGISRPVMKRFKGMLRQTGLLPVKNASDTSEEQDE